MGKKKNSYSFLVREKEDLDAARVAKEVREDNPDSVGFILTLGGREVVTVCLYKDFLNKFNGKAGNSPRVLNERLSPSWGFDFPPRLDKNKKLFISSIRTPQTFRTLVCGKSNIGLIKDIVLIRKEINQAKEMLNRFQITVKIL